MKLDGNWIHRVIDHPSTACPITIKKPRTVRGGAAESSSVKKAKVASEARSAASEITVSLDPKLLKCCVCCSTLVPPIFQCTRGHIACVGCCEELEYDCNLCGEPSNTRSHAVEHILYGMSVPCSFREHGCTDMIPFTQKPAHEESCLHAICYCPIAGCRPYARRSLRDHINLEHRTIQYTNVTTGTLCPLRMRDGELARFVSLGDRGEMFLLVVDRSVPSGRTLSVIHLAASAQAGQDDFKYKIQVYASTGILSLSGETQSVGRLTKAYDADASLFVSEAMWSPQDSPVYIELK